MISQSSAPVTLALVLFLENKKMHPKTLNDGNNGFLQQNGYACLGASAVAGAAEAAGAGVTLTAASLSDGGASGAGGV